MATILPFRALRYDPSKVKLEDVLTQPYDKITPEMQEKYYRASPHSLIAVELGRTLPNDTAQESVYTRAAAHLARLKEEKILAPDPEPSLYAYSQKFEAPGAPGTWAERRGFIGLCQLKDYAEKVVYRHEQTLSKPKADRLNLLRATKALTGQIFMLYSDPEGEVERPLWQYADRNAASAEMTDEYGVVHKLWRIHDRARVDAVKAAMAEKRLIIADGHHRYETGLNYRNERRGEAHGAADPNAAYESLMATFVNTDSEGVLILPTHRVVFGLAGFSPAKFLAGARALFEVSPIAAGTSTAAMMEQLRVAGASGPAFLAVTREGASLLRTKSAEIEQALPGTANELRRLDVLQLHKIVLERLLGISEEEIRNQTYLNYVRSADEAVERVRSGADVALLMNPVRIKQMEEVAFAGELMPQKSTDFYPKLLSGLTIYSVE